MKIKKFILPTIIILLALPIVIGVILFALIFIGIARENAAEEASYAPWKGKIHLENVKIVEIDKNNNGIKDTLDVSFSINSEANQILNPSYLEACIINETASGHKSRYVCNSIGVMTNESNVKPGINNFKISFYKIDKQISDLYADATKQYFHVVFVGRELPITSDQSEIKPPIDIFKYEKFTWEEYQKIGK